ncbi:hypothetical protein NFI96_000191 [Prochilodus magdalenae]|nr:hypothetical protein NFI96_000191 [Prochilodus magdalenae]
MEIIFLPTLSKDDDVYWMLVDQTFLKTRLKRAACLEQEVFVQPVKQVVSLWYTFGGGTKLAVGTGSTVKPSVSLLPPSSLQLSGGSASLLCLLSGYSPQGAQVSWTVGGSEVKEGVLTSGEEEKNGRYSRSSTLTLSKARWDQVEQVVCGSTVKPSVSLLPPSSLQLSGGSASLLCLLSGYSPQGAQVSWTVGGSEVKEGVLTSGEEEKNGRYSRSSTLTLSKARWDQGEEVVCKVSHSNQDQQIPILKSQCEG